ncbi:MAG: hypothetical protein E6G07_08520 [Actinobacteria bacterium]|nr:MAG: hypothetical protein E6G07_08520 [Actinomycetota bacterium]
MACALAALAAAPAAMADWHEPVGGASPINESSTRNSGNVNLATILGVPFVAWNEDTTQQGQGSSSTIHVAQLASNGLSWQKVADAGAHPISLLGSTSSDNPSVTGVGGAPWVAWQEGVTQTDTEIRVAHPNGAGTAWTEVPPAPANPSLNNINHPINHDRAATDGGGNAAYPTLRGDGTGHPFVSFFEADPGSGSLFFGNNFNPAEIWVDKLNANGDGWDEVGGGPANPDPTHDAAFPRMTVVGGVPWVVFFQVAIQNNNPALTIGVSHLSADGQSWVQLPAVASGNPNEFSNADIQNVGGTPYVAFGDNGGSGNHRIAVYKLNSQGNGWDVVGGGPASSASGDADHASLTGIGGAPWVSWRDSSTSSSAKLIRAARLVGGVWQQAGSSANADSSHPADFGPSLANVGGIPWAAFGENDLTTPGQNGPGCCDQARVSRLEPTFLLTRGDASDRSAALLTKVQTFGLPFRVGFKWGPGKTLIHTTPTSPMSDDPDYAFKEITGLSPSSLYTFEPFATAGTPLPLVVGSTDAFVTQSTPSTGPKGPPGPRGTPGHNAKLFVAIIHAPRHVHRGKHVKLRYVVDEDAAVTLRVTDAQGNRVARVVRFPHAGKHKITWDGLVGGSPPPSGLYKFTLTAHVGGQTDRDAVKVRLID